MMKLNCPHCLLGILYHDARFFGLSWNYKNGKSYENYHYSHRMICRGCGCVAWEWEMIK